MKKYNNMKRVITNSGCELQVGDTLSISVITYKNDFNIRSTGTRIIADEFFLQKLVNEGYAKEVVDIDMQEINHRIATKFRLNLNDTTTFMDILMSVYPASGLQLILREIALKLDEKYDNHISESPTLYVVDLFNGKISQVENKAVIKSYKHFAAFRTIEDAKAACRAVRPILKHMYSGK